MLVKVENEVRRLEVAYKREKKVQGKIKGDLNFVLQLQPQKKHHGTRTFQKQISLQRLEKKN